MSLQNPLNIYTCRECGGWIITRDVDKGVTPMMLACRVSEGCQGTMFSSGYHVPDYVRASQTRWEWYAPDEDERTTLDSASLDHVERGGLLLRDTGIGKGSYGGRK